MFNFFLTSVVFQKYYNSLQQKSLYRSRAVSPVEQGTIDCAYLAYFEPPQKIVKKKEGISLPKIVLTYCERKLF